MSSSRLRRLRAPDALRWMVFALLLFLPALSLRAQGCAQCLDSTRATPPSVQAAYRHAIVMLGSAGATLFIAGVLFLRSHR